MGSPEYPWSKDLCKGAVMSAQKLVEKMKRDVADFDLNLLYISIVPRGQVLGFSA